MRVIIFAGIFIVAVTVAYFLTKPSDVKPLKVYSPLDVNPELVDEGLQNVGIDHHIPAFSFTEHTGKTFTSKSLQGKVYVAEYFFATCGTICPIMNKEMQRVHQVFKQEKNFHILSLTVDPTKDTPEKLNEYAKEHNAKENWHFLTGQKEKLYDLARKGFFILKPAEAINQGDVGSDFIHTPYFVLVDQVGQIRGYYDGTKGNEVDRLIIEAKRLLTEK